METEEGNKLIFDFMGGIHSKHGDIDFLEMKNLKYHSSWDWLHSAWEKFRSLKISEIDEGFNDHYSRHLEAVGVGITHYPIEKAFERLVSAIQWYSLNKKV